MIISYEHFCDLILKHFEQGGDFYDTLLKNVIDNPSRYCGLFRLSTAKTKLIQNVTQSREIKFGDAVEEVITEYIKELGYENHDKDLGVDVNGDNLNVDQFFSDGDIIHIVEMKIRDDHDSTKKRGQYENFQKKIVRVRDLYPSNHLDASMWFVDDSLVKNKNYYLDMMRQDSFENVSLHLYYGEEFFEDLKNGVVAWSEFTENLKLYKQDKASIDIEIPDFGSSTEMLNALIRLPDKYWKKLMSNKEIYKQLREELFNSGDNLEKARNCRR